jgi:trans-2,3-dihydro-3-hydroxyanthranilate isomerase
MKKLQFYIVDVFTEHRYSGNQLAVIAGAENLPEKDMQKIAKEMNYSETTFILSKKKRDNGYDVRIFTPEQEIPFAGHPVLGTAFVIQQELIKRPIKKIKLNLQAGQIPVAFKYKGNRTERLWMKQNHAEFGRIIKGAEIAGILNLEAGAIDSRFPVQEVSTGLPFLIVPITNLESVKKAEIDTKGYMKLISGTEAKAIFVFCPETYEKENDLNARMFAPFYGIAEDPATGSANGCLAGYLLRHRYFKKDRVNIRVEQGYEMKRPSILFLRAEEKDGNTDIHVGGNVVMIAEGRLV